MARLSAPGTAALRSVGFHLGKLGLYSGKEVQPAQTSSVGVPRYLWKQLDQSTEGVRQLYLEVPEDAEELVDLRVTREERALGNHLGEDAASAPNVDSDRVLLRTKEDLRSAVPQSDDLSTKRHEEPRMVPYHHK